MTSVSFFKLPLLLCKTGIQLLTLPSMAGTSHAPPLAQNFLARYVKSSTLRQFLIAGV
jgi:hypothetical protein